MTKLKMTSNNSPLIIGHLFKFQVFKRGKSLKKTRTYPGFIQGSNAVSQRGTFTTFGPSVTKQLLVSIQNNKNLLFNKAHVTRRTEFGIGAAKLQDKKQSLYTYNTNKGSSAKIPNTLSIVLLSTCNPFLIYKYEGRSMRVSAASYNNFLPKPQFNLYVENLNGYLNEFLKTYKFEKLVNNYKEFNKQVLPYKLNKAITSVAQTPSLFGVKKEPVPCVPRVTLQQIKPVRIAYNKGLLNKISNTNKLKNSCFYKSYLNFSLLKPTQSSSTFIKLYPEFISSFKLDRSQINQIGLINKLGKFKKGFICSPKYEGRDKFLNFVVSRKGTYYFLQTKIKNTYIGKFKNDFNNSNFITTNKKISSNNPQHNILLGNSDYKTLNGKHTSFLLNKINHKSFLGYWLIPVAGLALLTPKFLSNGGAPEGVETPVVTYINNNKNKIKKGACSTGRASSSFSTSLEVSNPPAKTKAQQLIINKSYNNLYCFIKAKTTLSQQNKIGCKVVSALADTTANFKLPYLIGNLNWQEKHAPVVMSKLSNFGPVNFKSMYTNIKLYEGSGYKFNFNLPFNLYGELNFVNNLKSYKLNRQLKTSAINSASPILSAINPLYSNNFINFNNNINFITTENPLKLLKIKLENYHVSKKSIEKRFDLIPNIYQTKKPFDNYKEALNLINLNTKKKAKKQPLIKNLNKRLLTNAITFLNLFKKEPKPYNPKDLIVYNKVKATPALLYKLFYCTVHQKHLDRALLAIAQTPSCYLCANTKPLFNLNGLFTRQAEIVLTKLVKLSQLHPINLIKPSHQVLQDSGWLPPTQNNKNLRPLSPTQFAVQPIIKRGGQSTQAPNTPYLIKGNLNRGENQDVKVALVITRRMRAKPVLHASNLNNYLNLGIQNNYNVTKKNKKQILTFNNLYFNYINNKLKFFINTQQINFKFKLNNINNLRLHKKKVINLYKASKQNLNSLSVLLKHQKMFKNLVQAPVAPKALFNLTLQNNGLGEIKEININTYRLHLQKKRKAKKQRLETRRQKKRTRFFPRPLWLRYHMFFKFIKQRNNLNTVKAFSSKQKNFYKGARATVTPIAHLKTKGKAFSIKTIKNLLKGKFKCTGSVITNSPVAKQLQVFSSKGYEGAVVGAAKLSNSYLEPSFFGVYEREHPKTKQAKKINLRDIKIKANYINFKNQKTNNPTSLTEKEKNTLFRDFWLWVYNNTLTNNINQKLWWLLPNISSPTQNLLKIKFVAQAEKFKKEPKPYLNDLNKVYPLFNLVNSFKFAYITKQTKHTFAIARINWAINKTNTSSNEVLSKRYNLWATQKLRNQSKNNKTKLLEKKFITNWEKFFLNKNLNLFYKKIKSKLIEKTQKLNYLTYKLNRATSYKSIKSINLNKVKKVITKRPHTYKLNRGYNKFKFDKEGNQYESGGELNKKAIKIFNTSWWSTLNFLQSSCPPLASNKIHTYKLNSLSHALTYKPKNEEFLKSSNINLNYSSKAAVGSRVMGVNLFNLFGPSSLGLQETVLISSILFHLCALISLVSISQVRCFVKFHLILLYKLSNVYNELLQQTKIDNIQNYISNNLKTNNPIKYNKFKTVNEWPNVFPIREKQSISAKANTILHKLNRPSFFVKPTSINQDKHCLDFQVVGQAFRQNQNKLLTYFSINLLKKTFNPLLGRKVLAAPSWFMGALVRTPRSMRARVKTNTQHLTLNPDSSKYEGNKGPMLVAMPQWNLKPTLKNQEGYNLFASKAIYSKLNIISLKTLFYKQILNNSWHVISAKADTTLHHKKSYKVTSNKFKSATINQTYKLNKLYFKNQIFINYYNFYKYSKNKSVKVIFNLINLFQSSVRNISSFFEKPAEFTTTWIAYGFLIEWSSDFITILPENVDIYLWNVFSKMVKNIPINALYNNNLNFLALILQVNTTNSYKLNGAILKGILGNNGASAYNLNMGALTNTTGNINLPLINNFPALLTISHLLHRRILYLFDTLIETISQPDADLITRQEKGTLFWDIWADFLVTAADYYNVNVAALSTIKAEQNTLIENIANDFETRIKILNLFKHVKQDMNCYEGSFPFNKSNIGAGETLNLSVLNRWSVNQYITYQSTYQSGSNNSNGDLFIDYHPPKGFSHIPVLKHTSILQQPIGLLVCQIYSGIFNKQISKNVLLVNTKTITKQVLTDYNVLLIQALAGETELKIITDNAQRYAIVNRGFAIGIKLLRDVFDAIALNTPCIFLLEDIHAIGERRPMLISDYGGGMSDDNGSFKEDFFGSQRDEVHEKNQVVYQLTRHAITHYKKPFKGDYSLAIPTNLYVTDLFLKLPNTSNLSLSNNISNNTLVENQNLTIKNKIKNQLFNNNKIKSKNSYLQITKQLKSKNLNCLNKGLKNDVLLLKEEKKLKPNKIVEELPWTGLPGEQLATKPRTSYSVRAKVAMLAELSLSNMSAKLDMITDLLVIIDSVRSNKGFVVFATTDVPHVLDPALRRPGRLDETICLPTSLIMSSTVLKFTTNYEIIKSVKPTNNIHTLQNLNKCLIFANNLKPINWSFPLSSRYANASFYPNPPKQLNSGYTSAGSKNKYPTPQQANSQKKLRGLLPITVNLKDYNTVLRAAVKQAQLLNPLPITKYSENSSLNYALISHSTNLYKFKLRTLPLASLLNSNSNLNTSLNLGNLNVTNLNFEILKGKPMQKKKRQKKNKDKAIAYYEVGKVMLNYYLNTYYRAFNFIGQANIFGGDPLNIKTINYLSLYGSKNKIILQLMLIFGGKISQLLSSPTPTSLGLKGLVTNNIASGLQAPINLKLKGTSYIGGVNVGNENLRMATSIMLSFIHKRYLYRKNLIVPKLLSFTDGNVLEEPPCPPFSSLLIPAKRFENYKRVFRDSIVGDKMGQRKAQITLIEKLKYHTQLNSIKLLNAQVAQAEPVLHNKKQNNLIDLDFKKMDSLTGLNFSNNLLILAETTNINWYYQNRILKRHGQYLTNQWWNGQLSEHNAETVFLSDIDWRSSFIKNKNLKISNKTNLNLLSKNIYSFPPTSPSSFFTVNNLSNLPKLNKGLSQQKKSSDVLDVLLDFPDTDQYYNPRRRRWLLNKGLPSPCPHTDKFKGNLNKGFHKSDLLFIGGHRPSLNKPVLDLLQGAESTGAVITPTPDASANGNEGAGATNNTSLNSNKIDCKIALGTQGNTWNFWFNFDKVYSEEIVTTWLLESIIQTYKYLHNNTELLDFVTNKFIVLGYPNTNCLESVSSYLKTNQATAAYSKTELTSVKEIIITNSFKRF